MLLQSLFLFSFTKSVSVQFHKVGFCSVSQSRFLFSFTKSVSVRFHKVGFCSVSQSRFVFSFTKFVCVQVLVSCGPGDGCHGGDASAANEWIHKNGITDETCSIYQVLKKYIFSDHFIRLKVVITIYEVSWFRKQSNCLSLALST
jgi:hypothetical protein